MNNSDPKKIFLSYKSSDKALAVDFKETLEALGYDPWLDEDAMPAGTELERGLLRGMKESCAVVFLLTSSFKDEGYLATEINYAIAEKRQRRDKFAIICLKLEWDGGVVSVPELLKRFVWKRPQTPLHALRDIIRALPMVTTGIEWRDEELAVITAPEHTDQVTQLVDESKVILQEAAGGDGDGLILSLHTFGGRTIQTNGKSLIPNQEPKTVARWLDGLQDLELHAYIRDNQGKGEVFEVTRKGYEIADRMPGS